MLTPLNRLFYWGEVSTRQLFKPEVVKAAAKGVRLFEVDRRPTQRLKCEAVEVADLDSRHIAYVVCDFMEESWLACLMHAGFDITKKTYILWEGVTYYLDQSAVSATVNYFADNCAPGSTINFDMVDNLDKLPWLLRVVTRWIGEPWLFGLTCTEKSIRSWQESFGLEVKKIIIIKDTAMGPSNFAIVSVVRPNR
jgi:methyltransferase (TIGR00027 family)